MKLSKYIFTVFALLFVLHLQTRDICGLAKIRLNDIHTNWSHDGFWKLPFYEYCPLCHAAGENLARGQGSVEQVYAQWQQSPAHKKNLDRKWKSKCMVYDNYNGSSYFVEFYAD